VWTPIFNPLKIGYEYASNDDQSDSYDDQYNPQGQATFVILGHVDRSLGY